MQFSVFPLPVRAEAICPAQLDQAIAAITQAPQFRRARWGILVQTLQAENQSSSGADPAPGQTLYRENAEQYFTPASNAKLLTTAAALTQLGSQFRIRTSVYQLMGISPSETDSEVALQVVGRGDPSLTTKQLGQLAQQIRDRGITRIHRLILDDQYFRGDAINPSWEWEDVQAGYGAAVTSLILDQNAIGLTLVPQGLGAPLQVVWDDPEIGQRWQIDNRSRTVAVDAPEFLQVGRSLDPVSHQWVLQVSGQLRQGSEAEPVAISIPQPVIYFGEQLQRQLSAIGIPVDQIEIAHQPLPVGSQEIAAIDSAPLSELLAETNQESNNLYAEVMLRWLESPQSNRSESSLDSSLMALKTTLTRLGIDPDSYVLADGSGLSRRNLISPEALVKTLQQMVLSPNAAIYRNSLSVAGVSGTLRNRFQNTPVAGHLQGKTGYISGAVALTGYLQPSDYSPLVFSILVNAFDQPLSPVRQAVDEIVKTLADLEHC